MPCLPEFHVSWLNLGILQGQRSAPACARSGRSPSSQEKNDLLLLTSVLALLMYNDVQVPCNISPLVHFLLFAWQAVSRWRTAQ